MRSISLKSILTLSVFTTRKFKNSHFVSFSTIAHYQNPFSSLRPRSKEESRDIEVWVWWDFESCNLPRYTNGFKVEQCIKNALRANGINGPVNSGQAFGDFGQTSSWDELVDDPWIFDLTHVPSGGNNSEDKSRLVDLVYNITYWVTRNPPPAHLFFITGDGNFARILHRLRMNNYNVLLASSDNAPSVLCSAATIMWQWNSLLKGENLFGKLFNQPLMALMALILRVMAITILFSRTHLSWLQMLISLVQRQLQRILNSNPKRIEKSRW